MRRQYIPKPGTAKKRPLGIPTVRDRIVQTALRHVLEPIWEVKFADQSYGFRPGRGCKDALRRVQTLLRSGSTWVVEADIQSYYDSIDHVRLLAEVAKEVADGKVLGLIEALLGQPVMEATSKWTPEEGIPQGSTVGPLLANIYLHPLDEAMGRIGWEVTRYADDLVIRCRNEGEARAALRRLRQEMTQLGLTLHPEKTRVVNARHEGFDFLGYHFEGRSLRPREKSLASFKDRVRELTRRRDGNSLGCRSHLGVNGFAPMRPRGYGLRCKLEGAACDMMFESVPLAVEQDTPEMEHGLGAVSAPAHPWTIETHAHQVPDGAFDDAAADVEVLLAKLVVALLPTHPG